MTSFWILKSKVTKFYKEFETWFQIIFKFLVAFFVFGYINEQLGYYSALNNEGLRVVLSLISAIVPSSIFVLLAAIISLLHLYKLSLIMMALSFVVFIVFYFLYLKFAPEHGVLMLVIPVLMPLNLHFIVPLIAGLFFTPFTIVPVGCCFIILKFVQYIIKAAPMVDGIKLDVAAITEAYQFVIDSVLDNKEMLLYAGVFALVIVVTYVVSRLPFDYSWYVGIALGTIASIAGMFIGSGMLDVEISGGSVIMGSVVSGLIVALIQFLHCTVDYSRKEYVQFEDDDYYYYVKALPKVGEAPVEVGARDYQKHIISEDFSEEMPVEKAAEEKSGTRSIRAAKSKKAKNSAAKKSGSRRTSQRARDFDNDSDSRNISAGDFESAAEAELFEKYASEDTLKDDSAQTGSTSAFFESDPETASVGSKPLKHSESKPVRYDDFDAEDGYDAFDYDDTDSSDF